MRQLLIVVTLVVTLTSGCIGSRGTRARAYLINAGVVAAGGLLWIHAENNSAGDGDNVLLHAIGGLMLFGLGGAGALLTGVGQLGELTRDDDGGLVAVRPWTPAAMHAPFDPTSLDAHGRALAIQALEAVDCEVRLEHTDALWALDRAAHANLVRDPRIATCIEIDAAEQP